MHDPTVQRPAQARVLLTALAVPAVAILAHELGHHTAHGAFGYEQRSLSYDGASAGVPPAGVNARLADGVSFAAGTLVSLVLVAVAAWRRTPSVLALALVVFECIRAALTLVGAVGEKGPSALLGGAGELRYLARAFEWPPGAAVVLGVVEFAVPAAVAVVVIRRLPRARRLMSVGVAFLGSVAGLAAWLTVLGPAILP